MSDPARPIGQSSLVRSVCEQLAGEPVAIGTRMLLLGCAALGLLVLDLLLIGRWIATGRGPGLRALVHSF